MCRVLLVGHGRVGRAAFADYRGATLTDDTLMVTDPVVTVPFGFEWDGQLVDLAIVMVDTPADKDSFGFDYTDLREAVMQALVVADFVLVRSTVSLDFLGQRVYRENAQRIGYCPEFYGVTPNSRRGAVELGFTIFSDNVPDWVSDRVCIGKKLVAPIREAIVCKLTENAYLATKVTFFHELYLMCQTLGLDFDTVRELVTTDPRITPHHSYCDGHVGWSSHCFDKDVPEFLRLSPHDAWLVESVLWSNVDHLLPLSEHDGS